MNNKFSRGLDKSNFTNTVYINLNTISNCIELEINFIKNNSIFIRKISIYRKNLINILNKLKNNNFKIIMKNDNDNYNKPLNYSLDNYSSNINFQDDLIRKSYNQSFNQNFSK